MIASPDSNSFISVNTSQKKGKTLIVFLHGFSGSPTDFETVPNQFAKDGYSVFVPVLKGHCTKVSDLFNISFIDLCEDVQKKIDEVYDNSYFTKVIFVGYSVGSLIAFWLKEKYNANLFLVSTPFKLKRRVMLFTKLYPFKTIPKLDEHFKRSTKRRFFYDDVPASIVRVSIEGQRFIPDEFSASDYVILNPDLYTADIRKSDFFPPSSHHFLSQASHNLFWNKSGKKFIVKSLKEFINHDTG